MRTQLIVLCLLALAACQIEPVQQQTQKYPTLYFCPDGTSVEDPAKCAESDLESEPTNAQVVKETPRVEKKPIEQKPVESEPSEEDKTAFQELFETDEEATKKISDDVTEIRGRASEKAKDGYSYEYYERDSTGILLGVFDGVHTSAKGGMRLLSLRDRTKLLGVEAFSHILVDDVDKTATAWCAVGCTGDPFEFDRALVDFPSATFWLDQLESAEKIGERTLKTRRVFVLDAVVLGQQTEILVDSFSGIPVEVTVGDKTYVYERLSLGTSDGTFEIPQ